MKQLSIIIILMTVTSLHAMEQIDPAIFKAFFMSVHKTDIEAIKEVLEKYPQVTQYVAEYGQTALHYAVSPNISSEYNKSRVAEIVTLLIDAGADKEARSTHLYTPLGRAARDDNEEGVEALLKHGAQVHVWHDSIDSTPLGNAIEYSYFSITKLLLMAGASREALVADYCDKVDPYTLKEYLDERKTTDEIKHWVQNFEGPALPWQEAYRQCHKEFMVYGGLVATAVVDPRTSQEAIGPRKSPLDYSVPAANNKEEVPLPTSTVSEEKLQKFNELVLQAPRSYMDLRNPESK